MSRTVPVTVVVPTLDGGRRFLECRDGLLALDPAPERVLVVDSGSRDGTAEAAREAGFDVSGLDGHPFDHGGTRRRAVGKCDTPFVAFLSQDAVPEKRWLGALHEALASDDRAAGATARILPHPDASPLAARTVLDARTAGTEPLALELSGRRFEELPPAERAALCLFDDVASLARRDALLAHPFRDTMMGEDVRFARAVLEAGRRLLFVPGAVVRHSHEYGLSSAFARWKADAALQREVFGLRVRPGAWSVLRGVVYELARDARFVAERRPRGGLRALLRAPALRTAQVLGQWAGSREAGR